ncbi:mucin-2-like isoform X3 [Paramacrobiotus metropolitanus]|uniref:mucin-2-like isoform X3 n=1 Tax=Paramacrobiotus metropolitanus TaxID=2943436 RepID=UPI002445AFA6|nr:mucin-2-like isoform X3 [Paramacrobiotus metropolitanus]
MGSRKSRKRSPSSSSSSSESSGTSNPHPPPRPPLKKAEDIRAVKVQAARKPEQQKTSAAKPAASKPSVIKPAQPSLASVIVPKTVEKPYKIPKLPFKESEKRSASVVPVEKSDKKKKTEEFAASSSSSSSSTRKATARPTCPVCPVTSCPSTTCPVCTTRAPACPASSTSTTTASMTTSSTTTTTTTTTTAQDTRCAAEGVLQSRTLATVGFFFLFHGFCKWNSIFRCKSQRVSSFSKHSDATVKQRGYTVRVSSRGWWKLDLERFGYTCSRMTLRYHWKFGINV